MTLDGQRILLKKLGIAVAIPLSVGALSSLLTMGSMKAFGQLRQPPLSPPGWVFPVVWSGLYVMMGTASYLIDRSDVPKKAKQAALCAYGVTLLLNFLWPLLFFRAGMHLAAFLLLVALFGAVVVTAYLFGCLRPLAGYLFLPYLAWTVFAGYLNLGVYLLNR